MKKFILNAIYSIALIAVGILFFYLNWIKWIPFENYMGNDFFALIDFVWAYASFFLGSIFIGVGIAKNYIVIAFIRSLGLDI